MDTIAKLNPTDFVTVQGHYAVVNEGSGYAIVNIQTKEYLARNITSFLDCVKTLEYLSGKATQASQPLVVTAVTSQPNQSSQSTIQKLGVDKDVQELISKYAPTTVKIETKITLKGISYKCYDSSGYCLGRIKSDAGKYYWQYSFS